MSITSFSSDGNTYDITVYPPVSSDSKKYPLVVFIHGNGGLVGLLGDQIRGFARELASQGYNTAVPKYYTDDNPHPTDIIPKVQILTDAITALSTLPSVDNDRIGLVGFSLGATTAMSYIASNPKGTVTALADFYGFLTSDIRSGVSTFPPTIIFHNKKDIPVPIRNSEELDRLLPSTRDYQLITYDEDYPQFHHAFRPGGSADLDSKSQTFSWFNRHLPPTGT